MTEPDNLRERAARPHPPDEELERVLSGQDPAQVDEYWRQVAMSTFLLGRNGQLPERADLWSRIQKEIDPSQTATPRRLMRVPPPQERRSPRTPLWIAAAAVIGVILIFVIFSGGDPQPAPRKNMVQAPAPTPPASAGRSEATAPAEAPSVAPPLRREEGPSPAPAPKPEPPPPTPKPEEPKPVPPAPAPKPEEPKPTPPAPPSRAESTEIPAPVKPTEATVIVATLLKLEGDVSLLTDSGKSAVKAGDKIPAGRGLSTGDGTSAAVLAFTDGTRVELGAQTVARDLFEATGPGQGKRLFLERGTLTAEVMKQPAGQNMVFRTPDAEARVLGTTLKLTVPLTGPTRLDVKEGKVKFTRLSDGKAVDVTTGQFALAVVGAEFAPKPIVPPKPAVLLSETFEDPRAVEARWKKKTDGLPVKTAGRLDIDLTPRPGAADTKGWGGGGLASKQAFAAPFAVSLDVEIPELNPGMVTTVTFIPPGKKRGDEEVFRVQLRDNRYGLWSDGGGDARELIGVDRNGGKSCAERWRIEVDGAQVTFFAQDKEIFRHRHSLKAAAGYSIELDGSAKSDAPAGIRTSFDNVVVEKLSR